MERGGTPLNWEKYVYAIKVGLDVQFWFHLSGYRTDLALSRVLGMHELTAANSVVQQRYETDFKERLSVEL